MASFDIILPHTVVHVLVLYGIYMLLISITYQPKKRILESAGRDDRSQRNARVEGRGQFIPGMRGEESLALYQIDLFLLAW